MYCIYQGEKYKVDSYFNKMENKSIYYFKSKNKYDGFVEYKDQFGTVPGLYIKPIEKEDVDIIYEEEVQFKYRGMFFESFSIIIPIESIEEDHFMIVTDSYEIAHEFDFVKEEQFLFVKHIARAEIEAVKIQEIPIEFYRQKGMECKETIYEGDEIDALFERIKSTDDMM